MSHTNFNQGTPILYTGAVANTGVTGWVGTQMHKFRTTYGLGNDEIGGRPQSKNTLRFGKQTGKIAFFWTTIVFMAGTLSASAVITSYPGDPGRSSTNPFDYTNINITSNSATYSAASNIKDIFGDNLSTMEQPGRTIFADNANVVTNYQVSFTTNSAATITGYSLYLREDGPNSINRSATNFELIANGQVISNVALATLGQDYFVKFGSTDIIKVTDSFAPVTATSFQAIFTSNNSAFNGVRVYELDAQAVPEPSTIRLGLLGGLVLVAFIRRRAVR